MYTYIYTNIVGSQLPKSQWMIFAPPFKWPFNDLNGYHRVQPLSIPVLLLKHKHLNCHVVQQRKVSSSQPQTNDINYGNYV